MYESVSAQLTAVQNQPKGPLTFENLTICFSKRQITFKGRTMTAEGNMDCVTYPVTSEVELMVRAGYYPSSSIDWMKP